MVSHRDNRRHALVTGSSSGIGAAIVSRLVADGWHVIGLDKQAPVDGARGYQHVGVDLNDPDAVDQVVADLPPLRAFIHAAGFMRTAALGELNAQDGLDMWRIHVQAAESLLNVLLARLPDQARVVLIGSRTAGGAAGRSQYAATKAALVGMARSWAIELAPRGITVNVIAPGATDTPMLRDPARKTTPPVMPPIGRYVRPAEVAALAAFLTGEDAGAITGQQILMCGGASVS